VTLGRALGIASLGVLAGLLCALGASRLLTSLLFEVSAADPLALVGACGLLLVVAVAAAFVPPRWATKVDPAQVMRAD
jgi:putative ABC transport system permease protein